MCWFTDTGGSLADGYPALDSRRRDQHECAVVPAQRRHVPDSVFDHHAAVLLAPEVPHLRTAGKGAAFSAELRWGHETLAGEGARGPAGILDRVRVRRVQVAELA